MNRFIYNIDMIRDVTYLPSYILSDHSNGVFSSLEDGLTIINEVNNTITMKGDGIYQFMDASTGECITIDSHSYDFKETLIKLLKSHYW